MPVPCYFVVVFPGDGKRDFPALRLRLGRDLASAGSGSPCSSGLWPRSAPPILQGPSCLVTVTVTVVVQCHQKCNNILSYRLFISSPPFREKQFHSNTDNNIIMILSCTLTSFAAAWHGNWSGILAFCAHPPIICNNMPVIPIFIHI